MPNCPQPPILMDSAEELAQHVRDRPDLWTPYIREAYAWLLGAQTPTSQLQEQNARLAAQMEVLQTELERLRGGYESLRKEAQAEHDRLRKEAQAELLTMAIERATAIAEKAAALAERDRTLANAQSTVRLHTPDPSSVPAAEQTTGTPMGPAPPLAPASAPTARLSERLPDPDQFNGDRNNLRLFINQVKTKLTVNRDRFPSPAARTAYVINRLTGPAYNLILPYIQEGSCTLSDSDDVLAKLESAYGDPNRANNARQNLLKLRQNNKDFSTFYAEFQRLAMESQMPEGALPALLEIALSTELLQAMVHHHAPRNNLHEFAAFLQDLENRMRQYGGCPTITFSVPPRRRGSPPAPPPRGRSPGSRPNPPAATPPIPVAPAGDPMDLSHQRRNTRKENGECFRCGSRSHYVGQCPEPDTRRTRLHAAGTGRSSASSPTAVSPARRSSCDSRSSAGKGARLG